MVGMLLIMIVLSSIELHYKNLQSDSIKEGVRAIDACFMRHNTMVDINYVSRKIQLISSDIIAPVKHTGDMPKEVEYYQSKLQDHVSVLQDLEFKTIKAGIERKDREGGSTKQDENYQIKFLLQTGEVQLVENTFTEAIFQYVTASSSQTNATASSFKTIFTFGTDGENFPYYKENNFKDLFLVRENGLFVLRKGSEDIAEDFFKFYFDLTEDF